jgi:hypothetical protein
MFVIISPPVVARHRLLPMEIPHGQPRTFTAHLQLTADSDLLLTVPVGSRYVVLARTTQTHKHTHTHKHTYTHKTPLPTVPLLFRIDPLLRKGVYRATAYQWQPLPVLLFRLSAVMSHSCSRVAYERTAISSSPRGRACDVCDRLRERHLHVVLAPKSLLPVLTAYSLHSSWVTCRTALTLGLLLSIAMALLRGYVPQCASVTGGL